MLIAFLVGCSEPTFTEEGFNKWKNATGDTGRLTKHAQSRMHLPSMERFNSFKSESPSVHEQLVGSAQAAVSRKEKERKENRAIVEVIFDVIRHLAKQNSAFRAKDESMESMNQGNFLEELKFLAKYHMPLKKWMEEHPKNVSYFSHTTQNEMIGIVSEIIESMIKFEVKSAKYFSIQCDEVTSHKRAFMSIIVRYVFQCTIFERCVGLVRVDSLKGKNLAETTIEILQDLGLSLKDLVGKGFDGASNMSGKDEGVQRHLTNAGADKSFYFHCFAHRLNLVLEKSINEIAPVKDLFDTIGCIYRFMEGSPKRHAAYEKMLQAKSITKGKTALHSFSDTRWTARSDNLETVVNTMPALLAMLKEMSDEGDSAAEGLLIRMQKFKFVLGCQILRKFFLLSRSISEYLQHEDMDLVTAVSGIDSLKSSLSALRNEKQYARFITDAERYCQENMLSMDGFDKEDGAPSKRRRTIPACFRDGSSFLHDDGLVAAAQAQVASTSGQASSTFKRDFYLPVLDRLVSELEKRFSSDACKLLSDASVLHPTKFDETNVEKVASIAEWYGFKSEMAANEFVLLSKSNEVASWKKEYFDYVKEKETAENNQITKKPQAWLCLPTLLNVFKTNSLHNLYPNIFNVVKVVATLPVTVASCERAHSKIKIINNYLRASMSDDRLENLVQISIERDMADRIELDSLVDKFKAAGSRKLPL